MKTFTLRSIVFSAVFFMLNGTGRAQQTLTQINGWNAYVHLPANYNSSGSSYPTIIFFPGLGEVGTTASKVIANGPGAYISQGWNGNVVVDGNTIEFIVISLQPPAAYPAELAINQRIQTIKSLYRVNPSKLYLTGLSHGGWCSTTYVTGDSYGGPYSYASQVAAVVEVEGMRPDDNQPYSALFDNFAISGGKLLGFEQALDNRDIISRVNRMNFVVPGSGIYVQTNFGGGGHCCWNEFYGGQGKNPGIFSLGGVNQNLYQWMARQTLNSGTLPVTFSSFSGYKEGGVTRLRWTTGSEIENSGFEVQRADDGYNFISAGFVNSLAPGGNSAFSLSYTFTDNTISNGLRYYRLKQMDLSGHIKYSNVIRISGEKPVTMTIDGLYPNPTSHVVNIVINTPRKENATLLITDMVGRTMARQVVKVETGSNTVPVDISRLQKGTYMVKLVSGDLHATGSVFFGAQVISVL